MGRDAGPRRSTRLATKKKKVITSGDDNEATTTEDDEGESIIDCGYCDNVPAEDVDAVDPLWMRCGYCESVSHDHCIVTHRSLRASYSERARQQIRGMLCSFIFICQYSLSLFDEMMYR